MTYSMSNGLMVWGICLDPGIVAFCFASFALLQLGHPDRALERVEEAIEQARAHTRPHGLAYVLLWGAVVDHARGEPRRVLVRAEEAIEISTERGFPQHLGGGMVLRAWALSILADVEDAGRVVLGRRVPTTEGRDPFGARPRRGRGGREPLPPGVCSLYSSARVRPGVGGR